MQWECVNCWCSDLQQWRGSHPVEPHHAGSVAPPWASGLSNSRSFHRTTSTPGSPPAAVASPRPMPECVWNLSESVSAQSVGRAAWKASSGSCWPPAGDSHRLSQSASESRLPLRYPGRSESAHWGSSVGNEFYASRHRQRSDGWEGRGSTILWRCYKAPVQWYCSGSCCLERWRCWSQRAEGSDQTAPTLRGSGSQTELGLTQQRESTVLKSSIIFPPSSLTYTFGTKRLPGAFIFLLLCFNNDLLHPLHLYRWKKVCACFCALCISHHLPIFSWTSSRSKSMAIRSTSTQLSIVICIRKEIN